MTDLHPGQQVVGERFQLLRLLGTGGEGQVFLAHDIALDVDVVVKARTVEGAFHLDRLRREARLLMSIVPHRNLPIVRSDLVEGSRYLLISDFVSGRNLGSILASRGDPGLPLPLVLGYLDQIADALDHLHHHRPPVIHGDIKPDNLVVTDEGRLVIVDFGSALRVGEIGERCGTPGFTAPEVVAGEAVSPAADVYSVGAVAVALLTGMVPTVGAPVWDGLRAAQAQGLERVLRRALAFDPRRRPATVSELVTRIRQAADVEIPNGTVTLAYIDVGVAAVGHGMLAQIASVVETAQGRLLTVAAIEGPGILAAFARVHDALGAARTLQHRTFDNDSPPGPTVVTVGLHAGDLGGWHGTTLQQLVNETIGFTTSASRGSVICSPPVRMIAGNDDALHFEPTGPGYTVQDRRSRPAAVADLSGGLDASAWSKARTHRAMVGRTSALVDAEIAIERCHREGLAAAVVVGGEPGIGKTRLLAELACRAIDAGDRVLVGRCTESSGAYETFIDALGVELFAAGRSTRDDENWTDRRRFFARISGLLRAQGDALMLVIDDLQWIDGSSLSLLLHLLDELGAKLTVLLGYRTSPISLTVERLLNRPEARHLPLSPLGLPEVASMAAAAGATLTDSAMESLALLTGGNPFFALQVLEHLDGNPERQLDSPELPAGVRDWVHQRIGRLGDDIRSTLGPAAVMGRNFDVLTLADVVGASPLETLTQIERAVTTGLVLPGDHPGEFRFAHAIVRSALEDGLSSARRALLHAGFAQRLEAAGQDLETLELASHHWLMAGRMGNPMHAATIATEVATRVLDLHAHERAIAVLERALDALGTLRPSTERDRTEARARLVHGRADSSASNMEAALEQLQLAARLAASSGDHRTLAEAALAASLHRRHGRENPDLLALLETAIDACPEPETELLALLHVRRSRLLPSSVPHAERAAIARRGLAHANQMSALQRATVQTEVTRACWSPDDADERESTTTSLIADARHHLSLGHCEKWTTILVEGLNHRSAARVQRGDLIGALNDACDAGRIADATGDLFLLTRVRMGEAVIRAALGHHEEAERLAADAVSLSNQRHNLVLAQMALAWSIGRDRGQQAALAELERTLADFVDENPLFVAAFALVHAESGRHDDARRLLKRLGDLEWPRNWMWQATTVAALEAAVLVDDLTLVRRYADDLAPYSGQWALAAGEMACLGPIDRVLGMAHVALGNRGDGHRLLSDAYRVAEAQGARAWAQRCADGLATLTTASLTPPG